MHVLCLIWNRVLYRVDCVVTELNCGWIGTKQTFIEKNTSFEIRATSLRLIVLKLKKRYKRKIKLIVPHWGDDVINSSILSDWLFFSFFFLLNEISRAYKSITKIKDNAIDKSVCECAKIKRKKRHKIFPRKISELVRKKCQFSGRHTRN